MTLYINDNNDQIKLYVKAGYMNKINEIHKKMDDISKEMKDKSLSSYQRGKLKLALQDLDSERLKTSELMHNESVYLNGELVNHLMQILNETINNQENELQIIMNKLNDCNQKSEYLKWRLDDIVRCEVVISVLHNLKDRYNSMSKDVPAKEYINIYKNNLNDLKDEIMDGLRFNCQSASITCSTIEELKMFAKADFVKARNFSLHYTVEKIDRICNNNNIKMDDKMTNDEIEEYLSSHSLVLLSW